MKRTEILYKVKEHFVVILTIIGILLTIYVTIIIAKPNFEFIIICSSFCNYLPPVS